jgi:hypothetical protein
VSLRSFVANSLTVSTALLLLGCPKAEAPTPGEVSKQLRAHVPSIEALHAAAASGPVKDFLRLRENGLADLEIGESTSRVKERYGDANRIFNASGGVWWEYDQILRVASDQEPGPDGKAPKDITGTLRLFFSNLRASAPVVPMAHLESGALMRDLKTTLPANAKVEQAVSPVLTQIQAWAPGAQETRSMVRLLDPVSRIERKYGPAPKTLKLGWTGGEVWLYPAANVAFVLSPPQATEETAGLPAAPKTRFVSGTIVGL